jgi:hypothetical protein
MNRQINELRELLISANTKEGYDLLVKKYFAQSENLKTLEFELLDKKSQLELLTLRNRKSEVVTSTILLNCFYFFIANFYTRKICKL